ncbi:amidohydrolase family protein [Pseudomarimonas arenosa]|uniref:Amidohydrolase family protein n=1 Tax=Pseudomarimonas arenosa TaxID=2774145 RepID=A0AAW3ZQ16_9GAMM|nr:amidohydrolase family protein [Pseudomarimonas arenosa]MBD8527247.1 amidohydrolase family protein [Pseudomarimonas arenosa]
MRKQHDPEGLRLPIKLDSTSNGEFAPVPLEPVHRRANRLALDQADRLAKRAASTRRGFLTSACGAASTLLFFNQAFASAGKRGGFYQLSAEAAEDQALAVAEIGGNEFIFDVQGHFVNPTGAWTRRLPESARPLTFPDTSGCAAAALPGNLDHLQCLGPDAFIQDIFLDSDTDLTVLSFVPSTRASEPLTIEEAAATAAVVEKMQGTHRLYLHGRVNPNQAGDVEDMERLAGSFNIAAWKTYTQWGPERKGFFMDDEPGLRMIEEARRLKVPNIAIHKGLPFGPDSYEHSTCQEIGRVAKRFSDVNFLIYHSGFVTGTPEGPLDEQRNDGIDGLVNALRGAELGRQHNVFAELGSTWRFLMRDPDSAAHALGKLLLHVGEDNILWGTDSIWYGSPQDQIQAFRTFQISPEFRERYGYPEITPQIRAKIFGLNALRIYPVAEDVLDRHLKRDAIAQARANYANQPNPHFRTYGPKTRREFLNLLRWS